MQLRLNGHKVEQSINREIKLSIDRVLSWVEKNNYMAYEPFDGNSSYLYKLTCGNLFLQRILQHSVLRFPINLRPVLGIPRQRSSEGMGYIAWGYLIMYRITKDEKYCKKAMNCLDWLSTERSPFHKEFCWGEPFHYASRGGKILKGEPTIVWTSLIGQVFLDAYELLNDMKYLDIAISSCRWIESLPMKKTKRGGCLSYVASVQNSIHNSNMLGAALLARTAYMCGQREFFKKARKAMIYSCSHQNRDGSWYYGQAPKYHWIDNFHTGYNLDSLKRYILYSGDMSFKSNIERGFEYYKRTFFINESIPKYYHNSLYPIDIQCAAQSIDTLTFFSEIDPSSLDLARKVARWVILNMQDRLGYFYYRRLSWTTVKTPMLHWGQGTMFKALSYMLSKLTAENSTI